MTATHPEDLLGLTAQIVSAYLGRAQILPHEIEMLIGSVHGALASIANPQPVLPVAAQNLVPFVPVKKSITPDYIFCLEDGKKLKMLKRHLRTSYGMSTEDYRTRWGLPDDYPMVAPNYARKRSELAKAIGLGRKA